MPLKLFKLNLRKSTLTTFVVIASFVVGGYITYESHESTIVISGVKTSPPIVKFDPIYSYSLADDRVLVGASHDVSVGKVLARVGTRMLDLGEGNSVPISQFTVEPIFNIKGNL
jgi:hypothetical protein